MTHQSDTTSPRAQTTVYPPPLEQGWWVNTIFVRIDHVFGPKSASYTPPLCAHLLLVVGNWVADQKEGTMPRRTSPQKQNLPRHQAGQVSMFSSYVEVRGFEPLTFSMPWRRATNCAIPPSTRPILKFQRSKRKTALKPNAQLEPISWSHHGLY